MKKYVIPQISFFDLRSEENIATVVECHIGACHDVETGAAIWVGNGPS